MIFSWQMQIWQKLWQARRAERLPHALLFSGIPGIGKTSLAEHFSRALLCQQPTDKIEIACQTCHACRLISGGVHPNCLWITPEKEGQAIKIDQIREASDFIAQTSLQGEYRILIIHPADQLNMNAANALLKTLEEPPQAAIIILINNQSGRLPATILSRCQRFNFARPAKQQALVWLKEEMARDKKELAADQDHAELLLRIANGAPLTALKWLREEVLPIREQFFQLLYQLGQGQADPLTLAAQFQSVEPLSLIDFMLSWMVDLLLIQLHGQLVEIKNQDFKQQLAAMQQQTQLKHNTNLLVYLQQLRSQLCAGINFNKQLMLESILIRWMECATCSS